MRSDLLQLPLFLFSLWRLAVDFLYSSILLIFVFMVYMEISLWTQFSSISSGMEEQLIYFSNQIFQKMNPKSNNLPKSPKLDMVDKHCHKQLKKEIIDLNQVDSSQNFTVHKFMRSKSTSKLPNRSFSKEKDKEPSIVSHRKEIESTLRELHRLQSEIYELNVPENPHSSSPVKKEIKQLSYLYENMAKPKARNSLDIKSEDIELATRIMNNDWNVQTKLEDQINDDGQLGMTKGNFKLEPDASYKIPKDVLQQKFESLTNCSINLAFISDDESKEDISVRDLYKFMNYTEVDDFDPISEAYKMFLNERDEFDLNLYNKFNEALGLPKIKSFNTLLAAVHHNSKTEQKESQNISLEEFRSIISMEM